MSILITGGAGYIGRHTWTLLERCGHQLVLFDRVAAPLLLTAPRSRYVQGELANVDLLRRTLREYRVSTVLHLAASVHPGDSMRRPEAYYANNVAGSLALLNAMAAEGVHRLVFGSSCSVYGDAVSGAAAHEDDPVQPINPYGESKLVLERALPWYAHACGLRWIALRYFNVAGAIPGLGEDLRSSRRIVPRAICAALGIGPALPLFGNEFRTADGSAIRDLVHVADVALANRLAIEYTRHSDAGAVVNVGSGRGTSVHQVLEEVRAQTGRPVPHEVRPARLGDPARIVADISNARDLLGWSPATSTVRSIVASSLSPLRQVLSIPPGSQRPAGADLLLHH